MKLSKFHKLTETFKFKLRIKMLTSKKKKKFSKDKKKTKEENHRRDDRNYWITFIIQRYSYMEILELK